MSAYPAAASRDSDSSVASLPARFATAMDQLGPWEPSPRLAAAVSGGADSLALALLADRWARQRGGTLLTLVVDHGLRPESAAEAADTRARLAATGISSRLLPVDRLNPGPALAERARAARYGRLTGACAEAGILHLLLGHHRGDQAETLMHRVLRGSGDRGLAGMAALTETASLRLLRPLLAEPKATLCQYLAVSGLSWVEDPSNRDPRALRARLRALHADPNGTGEGTASLAEAARRAGLARTRQDARIAAVLAQKVRLRPEGFAVLSPGPVDPEALAAVIQCVGGTAYRPSSGALANLAADPRPATLAGVRLLPAGRLGPGLLLVREEAAMAGPVPATPSTIWDNRFRLVRSPGSGDTRSMQFSHAVLIDALPPPPASSDASPARLPHLPGPANAEYGRLAGDRFGEPPAAGVNGPATRNSLTISALGGDARLFRRSSGLPAAVLRTLPAIRDGNSLAAVPHLSYCAASSWLHLRLLFHPRSPAAGGAFRTI